MSILAKHIHTNADPHKLTALDANTLKCWSCGHTLDVRPRQAVPSPTSTSRTPLGFKDPQACPEHVGQLANSCGPCRSERIAGDR